jgi:cell division protein FtsW
MTTLKSPILYDRYLLLAAIAIVSIGVMMVASASMVISDRIYGEPFYFLIHQTVFLLIGIIISWFLFRYRMTQWQQWSSQLLLASLFLLALVLIPGIGHEVNGSMRWIGIGPIGIQVSEFAKLALILYLASYLVRREEEVQSRIRGFLKPLLVMGVLAILLLKEPDFGATSVITATALGMLFLAGVKPWQFIILLSAAILVFALLAISSPYRLQRLTTFMHPWQNAYASGYQLTQSLIAFGHGGIFGVGLGKSVQKLFYLPEAHTDFIFAVLSEELGLFGALVMMGLFLLLIVRAFLVSYAAYQQKLLYGSYTAAGIGLWLAIQTTISIGVNTGLFPTKGLTLPLMSYGGSSMIINCIAIMLLLRIDHEARIYQLGLQREIFPDA